MPNPTTAAEHFAQQVASRKSPEEFVRWIKEQPTMDQAVQILDAYAHQQVEAAYREGAHQGKMRFTRMKIREALEEAEKVCESHMHHGDPACLAAVKREIAALRGGTG